MSPEKQTLKLERTVGDSFLQSFLAVSEGRLDVILESQ